jgi:hypothetical protein
MKLWTKLLKNGLKKNRKANPAESEAGEKPCSASSFPGIRSAGARTPGVNPSFAGRLRWPGWIDRHQSKQEGPHREGV